MSLAALITAVGAGGARAQSVAALMAATHQTTVLSTATASPVGAAGTGTSAAMALATARALQYQTQLNSAQNLAQQAQAAARAAVAAMNQNLMGVNKVATISEGLTTGCNPGQAACGLTPGVTKVTAATADATGVATWQGANLPTQTISTANSGASYQVDVVQTAPQAVLSWTTFNVGQHTTLTFQQQVNGASASQPSWIVLNRVVGSVSPTLILGSIQTNEEVVVLDHNGIVFGPTSQVNVGSLIASSLEIGEATEITTLGQVETFDLQARNEQFLQYGLLGYAEEQQGNADGVVYALSGAATAGSVQVEQGASVTSADAGFLLFAAPQVVSAGQLSSADGEVALQSGEGIVLGASEGTASSPDPDVRGLVVTSTGGATDSTSNAPDAIIEAPRSYISLGSSPSGSVTVAGLVRSTTSVSEDGDINIFGQTITIAPGAVISVGPDSSATTIPQDPNSLADFKPSRIRIGLYTPGSLNPTTGVESLPSTQGGVIDIGGGSLIYGPGASISIGADAGEAPLLSTSTSPPSAVTVESGAVIDAAGLTDVLIPASRNSIEIDPVKGNELADAPAFRNGFLNGAAVFLDPRLSGVTADGVAWIGSPLISAQAYVQQVGISVEELMVAGGNVTLGVASAPTGSTPAQAPKVIVSPGATIDVSGGWKTYQAGEVQQTYLVDSSGEVIPISQANPDDTYVAVYNGYTVNQPRWGVSQTYVNPVLDGAYQEGQYTEGQDAGSLTLTASDIALGGQVFAGAFAGPEQILGATTGTASGTVAGDLRALQGAPSQLPAGGYLDVQALNVTTLGAYAGGGDIEIVGSGSYAYTSGTSTTISLNADAVSAMGLSQLTVQTTGKIDVARDASIVLAAGGAFEVLAGRTITIEGSIAAPGGRIDVTTADFGLGSVLTPEPLAGETATQPGSFDIVVDGQLDVAGRWANDFNQPAGQLAGSAYLNGGEITMDAAPRVTLASDAPLSNLLGSPPACATGAGCIATDISGSILINSGALLNASGGGYVTTTGGFVLTAKGGDVSLYDDTTYFPIIFADNPDPGGVPGFTVNGVSVANEPYIPVNPAQIVSRISIADGSIEDQGFAGGGAFTMSTPQFTFGPSAVAFGGAGAALPLDFFSAAGFASYKITTYKTDLFANTADSGTNNGYFENGGNGYFDNGLGGYNAVLATDIATVGAGQTLNLSQSYFSPLLSVGEISALQALGTGGSLYSVLTPGVPSDAWDQKPVNLTLGGLTELRVAQGGQVTGAAGVTLTVGELYNRGDIRLPGGALVQSLVVPALYSDEESPVGVTNLGQVFSTNPATGAIEEMPAPGAGDEAGSPGVNTAGLKAANGTLLSNAQVAATTPIYILGDLPEGVGVYLAPGSITDLSGEALVNPRAAPQGNLSAADFVGGTVVAGGSLTSTDVFAAGGSLFQPSHGVAAYGTLLADDASANMTAGLAQTLTAMPGSVINLAGAQATFDEPTIPDAPPAGSPPASYAPTLVWSNGGNLTLGSGGTITGAQIYAAGGAPLALGGTLTVLDPVLYQTDPATATPNEISVGLFGDAAPSALGGFATLVAEGGLTSSSGAVTLSLSRSLFVETPATFLTAGLTDLQIADADSPVIGSGGNLIIRAPYIGLDGAFQTLTKANPRTLNDGPGSASGSHSLTLIAGAIDVTGAVAFDSSVGQAVLSTTGALRLIGVTPTTIGVSTPPAATLIGQLAVSGNLTLQAGQVYPTTGSTFAITSAAAQGSIAFEPDGATPATPYSAGGALIVLADTIDQAGVVRVPLGALTLGATPASLSSLALGPAGAPLVRLSAFAPATADLVLEPGSITSVSADGLTIPYGTTTDQVEWYFTPTNSNPLTGPPAGVLQLAGGSVTVAAGSTIDLKGGGDVYAYEFVSGPGGTRDVLDQYNTDAFSSTNGCQYPDCRQVYAIVPGLSSAQVAALDPIYSTNYSALYGPSQAGLSVYLNAAPGLAAGWYTLLPAQYAFLPGGMRVVQDTASSIPPPVNGTTLTDGTVVTSGYFGVAGVDTRSATLSVFDVQSQSLIKSESDIALTYGDTTFAADAATAGAPTPQLPIDAGRLILSPLTSLTLAGAFETTPATGGRGSEVDISGTSLTVEPADFTTPPADTIVLTDASLSALDAASLFLGGVRTDNSDGTTALDVTSNLITIASGADLTAPEILIAVDGKKSKLTVEDGASILATGKVTGEATGDYIFEGVSTGTKKPVYTQDGKASFLRVSNGPQRLVTRLDVAPGHGPGSIVIGDSTLDGASVELNALGAVRIAEGVAIEASNIALGARRVSFGSGGAGLAITPALQAILDAATTVTIQTPNIITFASGTYDLPDVTLDTPGLKVTKNGSVTVDAGNLTLADSSAAKGACGSKTSLACGAGALTLSATQIAFGSGTVRTYGAGASVTLDAADGMFVDGAATLNAGPAALTLNTPFLGDRGAGAAGAAIPSLTLTTTGALAIASATPASAFKTAPAGTPGADLTIDAASVSIAGAELRATAGTLQINSATGIAISGGALLATPAYAQMFGDSADPTTVTAPGGLLSLTALNGDIAVSDDSTFSVGGAQGQAGTLSLIAQNGSVYAYHGVTTDVVSLASTFSAAAPGGGGSLILDSGGAFDLSSFAAGSGQQFTGAVSIRTGAGDLTLAADDTLTATSVSLTADGGQVADSGTIDTAGANGGNVSLYGATGVHLTSTALIDAHANGYGATSTLQASGGDVTLGVDGTGAIAVDQGAVIDVAASNPADRLVPMSRTDGTYYTFVAGDVGGAVTFRAPVITGSDGETVDVTVQGAVQGASTIVLEGFKRWDLATLASNPNYVGVSVSEGVATLDLAATGDGKINALADPNGPIVQFVQNFNVSADYGALNDLASQANFNAQPGIELEYSGSVVLNSNWNLGAGVVNVAAAVKAGLMVADVGLAGQYAVVQSDEGALLAGYTTALYRVGGTFYGEPGVLTIRAGGSLTLNGSITDGFFQFGDQTDPGYLTYATGEISQYALAPSCSAGNCASVGGWSTKGPTHFVDISFPDIANELATNPLSLAIPAAPYSAAANSPAALGDAPVAGEALLTGSGDPLGSAQIFPLLPGAQAIGSWSYQLVGGADLTGSAGHPSVNPLTTSVAAGAGGGVVVQGYNLYSYQPVIAYADTLDVSVGGLDYTPDQGLDAFEGQNDLNSRSYSRIAFNGAPTAARPVLEALGESFFSTIPADEYKTQADGAITTTLAIAGQFLDYVSNNFAAVAADYRAPVLGAPPRLPIEATAPTLVRTGTGSIAIAASGDIDLSNGSDAAAATKLFGADPGGAAVYTVGHMADLTSVTFTDPSTMATDTVDLAASPALVNSFATPDTYEYGSPAGLGNQGIAGILVANPVYATGGGSVTLSAGIDVLSERDTLIETELGGIGDINPVTLTLYPWIGSGAQPWRTGQIGGQTTAQADPTLHGDGVTTLGASAQIDPQLFNEGVGTLGGGAISIRAGRNISDLSVVATDSLTTGFYAGGAGAPGAAQAQFGGGDIQMFAGGEILGGRLDVASGGATIQAQGGFTSAGNLLEGSSSVANTLRVLLSDATVHLLSGGPTTLQGVAALGVKSEDENSAGFYSATAGLSILSDGAIDIENSGNDVTVSPTGPGGPAVYPGSFTAVSFSGGLDLSAGDSSAAELVLYPSPAGTLTLLADGAIAPVTIAEEDADPSILPGVFSTYVNGGAGLPFEFPAVLSNTSDVTLREQHNETPTHQGDAVPNRIAAGGDITNMIIATAKQTRIAAGVDITNMVFVGQNLGSTDITRITAGRDITATTTLESPYVETSRGVQQSDSVKLPAVQGNTFILGGPGALFVEAGRNAGPFLTSSVTDGFASPNLTSTGLLTYGGGIITVGNLYDPWLPSQGASIYTEFGVAPGQDFAALTSTYLDPANFANLPEYEFLQTTDASGNQVADRSAEVYALSLAQWEQSIAANVISLYDTAQKVSAPPANAPALIKFMQNLENGVTPTFAQALTYLPQLSDQTMPLIPWLQLNFGSALSAAYGTENVSYTQALGVFEAMPTLTQREFLVSDVYFNELTQTSVPTSPSYLVYSRGYTAVNTLFPGTDGYTQNSLNGGKAGALTTVVTGNLDLRLATIQTEEGGDIAILGPGGRVLAGSDVATAVQASRRVSDAGLLYSGGVQVGAPLTAAITAIPPGYEGVLTLKGGDIDSFTDGDFLLNQSRAFTEAGGNIAIWSSNADVNAGEGPRTTADVPPVVVLVDENGYSQDSTDSAVSGAGIGAFQPDAADLAPTIYLLAPRGTVDAGAAGVRSAGNVFIAAYQVANANAIQAQGTIVGAGGPAAVNVNAQASGDAAATAAAQAAQAAVVSSGEQIVRPTIIVDVLGFLPDELNICTDEDKRHGKCQ